MPPPNDGQTGTLRLVYSGGLANKGRLLLDEYAASLSGWRELLQRGAELLLRSTPELRELPGSELLTIEVIAERQGSYEAVLLFTLGAAAAGMIGNRADAAVVWTFRKLIEWYRDLVSAQVSAKRRTTNIDEIVAALEDMARTHGVTLDQPASAVDDGEPGLLAFSMDRVIEDDDGDVDLPDVGRARVAVERLHSALESATRPLDQSCESISVIADNRPPLFQLGRLDRQAIVQPLSLPLPNGDWAHAKVKFVRINKKTGRALFYFDGEPQSHHGAHFSRIVDPAVRDPDNVYTRAFNDDAVLDVWIRQRRAERNRLNLLWELSAKPPVQGTLFKDQH